MAFIYECSIKIHSVIDNLDELGLPEGDPEINIITTDGFLKAKDGLICLDYKEVSEENKTLVSLSVDEGGRVELSRRGAVVCDMIFAEGEEHCCLYQIPPYSFDMTLKTKKVRTTLSRSGGELQLIYSMNVGGQDKNVRMKIRVEVK